MLGEAIPEYKIKDFNDRLEEFGLSEKGNFWKRGFIITDKTVLNIYQAKDESELLKNKITNLSNNLSKEVRMGIIEDIYKKNEAILNSKNAQIEFLENKLISLEKDSIPFIQLRKEIQIQYPKIEKFAYSETIEISENEKLDTIPTFLIKWNGYAWKKLKATQKENIKKWLKIRLNLDTVRVVEYE